MDESMPDWSSGGEEPESTSGEWPSEAEEPQRWLKKSRTRFLFAGVVAPIIGFATMAVQEPFNPTWQSGSVDAYAQLLLQLKSMVPFYPLFGYSMVSLVLLVFAPEQYAPKFWVRWGIYGGLLLALHFCCLVSQSFVGGKPSFDAFVEGLAAWVFISTIVIGVSLLVLRGFRVVFVSPHVRLALGGLSALVLIMLAILYSDDPLEMIARAPLLLAHLIGWACLFFGASWAVAAYGWLAFYLFRQPRSHRGWGLLRFFGVFTWITAYIGAWGMAVTQMLEEYAGLPTTRPTTHPGCYIATAAARGHRRFVGARLHRAADGRCFAVNDQLCRLKCFELILAHCLPRAHRVCRWAYDRVGPPAAALLVHPLLADAAYLLLKPAEWVSLALLAALGRRGREATRKIYGGEADGR